MIIVDTAPLVAAALVNDENHLRCTEVFEQMHRRREDLAVPCHVVLETCYMLAREGGSTAAARFLRSLNGRDFTQLDLDYQDILRAAELLDTYADLRLDAAALQSCHLLSATMSTQLSP
jgi:predicted nucleic acid-binding protein